MCDSQVVGVSPEVKTSYIVGYMIDRGFGFIKDEPENTFFHITDVVNETYLDTSVYGYDVSYHCIVNPNAPDKLMAKDIRVEKISPKYPLLEWAEFDNWQRRIEELKTLALKGEDWDFKDTSNNHILSNYLWYTFEKLRNDNDVLENVLKKDDGSIEEYAAFDTGLVNPIYKPIYAFFVKNKWPDTRNSNPPPWYFKSFCCVPDVGDGKLLGRIFNNKMPSRAKYYDDIKEVIYDNYSRDIVFTEYHILIENADRLPPEFVKKRYPSEVVLLVEDLKKWRRKQEKVKRIFPKDNPYGDESWFKEAFARLRYAVELARKRAIWNYKTTVPVYYPARPSARSFLLPLALVDDSKTDIALVVEKHEDGYLEGHTILTFEQAYKNARLVVRPDSDWLSPKSIKMDKSSENDE